MKIYRCAKCSRREQTKPEMCIDCGGRDFKEDEETPSEICKREGHDYGRSWSTDEEGHDREFHKVWLEECRRCHRVSEVADTSAFGACYLTSACTEAMSLPDNCGALTALRRFRDTYVALLPDGARVLEEYYATAPQVVAAIRRLPDNLERFQAIYKSFVVPVADLIESGQFSHAYQLYRDQCERLRESYIELHG